MSYFREIISACKRKENNVIFFSYETYTRWFIIIFGKFQVRHKLENYYYNWFNDNKIIWNLSHSFSLERERVFYINICVLMCDCFWLVILVIILFGPQYLSELLFTNVQNIRNPSNSYIYKIVHYSITKFLN